ncbi:MAG: diguanylate cyclase [Nitrospirae bacterium]|nr:diguanylate cyclase [Nitrospirota bacterium]
MKPGIIFLRILTIVIVTEALVMVCFDFLNIYGTWAILIDIVSLAAISSPLIYVRVVEPAGQELRIRLNAIDAAGEMIVITDRNGVIEYVNSAFTRITGYTRAEIIGRKPSLLKSGTQDQVFYRSLWQTILMPGVWSGEIVNRRKDGTLYPEEQTITPVTDAKGRVIRFVAIKRDITGRKQMEETLRFQATHDSLTHLPNRTLLNDRLQRAILTGQRDKTPVAVLVMDLNRFKEINDTLGHHQGDFVLQEIGPRLQRCLRASDTIARFGGDEFVIFLPGIDAHGASIVAQKVLKTVAVPFIIEDRPIVVEASIGIALYPDHGVNDEILIQHADGAMYEAKVSGNGYAVYNPEQNHHSLRRLTLMGELGQVIENDQLLLYYQPKVNLQSKRVTGVEALVRWQHPEYGLIPPDQFIIPAERTGLIKPLTWWV